MQKPVILTVIEAEAICWGLSIIGDAPNRPIEGVDDPLIQLRRSFAEPEITAACKRLESGFQHPNLFLNPPFSPCEREVLRCCIENADWIASYGELIPEKQGDAHKSLLGLAKKLDAIGVEINYLPPLNDG